MHDLYIAEIYRPLAIFLLLTEWLCLHSVLHSNPQKNCIMVIQAHQN